MLKVRPLTEQRIAQCFPLVHLTAPDLTPEGWLNFAETHLSCGEARRNGMLMAQQDDGCILGLVVYTIEPDPLRGRTLLVKNMIAHDYFAAGRQRVELALIEEIDKLAKEEGCTAVHILMPLKDKQGKAQRSLTKELEAQGHALSGVSYCKALSV